MKIVTAYSGGLDTSCMIPWLKENYGGADILAFTGDLGQGEDLPAIKAKALRTGASKAFVEDLQEQFINEFIWPAVRAGALYEGTYPLHTALGRPLLAKKLVDVALAEGADGVAHGCTGKGNDQVRFEVTIKALPPPLQILAPLNAWITRGPVQSRLSRAVQNARPAASRCPSPSRSRSPSTRTSGAAPLSAARWRTSGTSRPPTPGA